MKKILIILSIVLIIIIGNKENSKIVIPQNAIRIRVIANSNSIEDQMTKLKIKEDITENLYKKLTNVKSIDEARINIKQSIPELKDVIAKNLNNNNFDINYGNNYFPEKKLYGVNYEGGIYESLIINIGESKGNNWWCVLFPPLCMIETEERNFEHIEYKSKVLEILNKYK